MILMILVYKVLVYMFVRIVGFDFYIFVVFFLDCLYFIGEVYGFGFFVYFLVSLYVV